MMTREELEKVIDEIKVDSDYPWLHKLGYILQNDQAQREEIEQQARDIESLQKCQCEGCDNSLEGEAYCQCCWMKMNQENQAQREEIAKLTDCYKNAVLKAELQLRRREP